MDFNDKFKKAVRENFNRSTRDYLLLEEEYGFFDSLTASLISAVGLSDQRKESITSILDIGCGTGSSTRRLNELFPGAYVVGLDLSEKMVAAAEKNHPDLDFICGDGENIDSYFPPNLFNLIIYPASLFLMPDQAKTLAAAEKLLKENGIVAASILLGLKEKTNREVENLPIFRGILKNVSVEDIFEALFDGVESKAVTIELDQHLLSAIYRIEALSAGAFQGKTKEERNQELKRLLAEVERENLTLMQEWRFIFGHKRKTSN